MGRRSNGAGNITWHKATGRWMGQITVDAKRQTAYPAKGAPKEAAVSLLTELRHKPDAGRALNTRRLSVGRYVMPGARREAARIVDDPFGTA